MHRWGAAGRLAGYSGEIRTRMPTSHPIVAILNRDVHESSSCAMYATALAYSTQIVTKRVLVLSVCPAATTPIYPRCRSPDITPLGTVTVLAKLPMPWKFQKSLPWVIFLSALKVASETSSNMDTLIRSSTWCGSWSKYWGGAHGFWPNPPSRLDPDGPANLAGWHSFAEKWTN